MMRVIALPALVLALVVPVPAARAADMGTGGCCAKTSGAAAGCSHAASEGCSHGGPVVAASPAMPKTALTPEVARVFERYFELQQELAKDSTKNVASSSKALATAMRTSGSGCLAGSAATAEAVGKTAELKAIRAEFAKLSDLMLQFVTIANVSGYHGFYCSMAKAGWLQADAKMRNPYMGPAMLQCGEKVL